MAKGKAKREARERHEQIVLMVAELLDTKDRDHAEAVKRYVDIYWNDAKGSAYQLINVLFQFKGEPEHEALAKYHDPGIVQPKELV